MTPELQFPESAGDRYAARSYSLISGDHRTVDPVQLGPGFCRRRAEARTTSRRSSPRSRRRALMIYLDSAAVVKLVHAEPESPALRHWLDERAETGWISSVLTETESFRALARYVPEAVSRLPAVLDQIDLIDLDPRIRILARAVQPVTVRSLDAIHLGTALYSRPGLTSFVTYDTRLLDAARIAGLQVDSPT
jgi:predicted nucleic acid-binding protein